MEGPPTRKRDGIVIYESRTLIWEGSGSNGNGIRRGWVAILCLPNGDEPPEPFGFAGSPGEALADLEAQL